MACGQEARSVTPGCLAVQPAPTLYTLRVIRIRLRVGRRRREGRSTKRGSQPRQKKVYTLERGERTERASERASARVEGETVQGRGRAIILGGPMPVRDLCAALSRRVPRTRTRFLPPKGARAAAIARRPGYCIRYRAAASFDHGNRLRSRGRRVVRRAGKLPRGSV